MSRYDSPELLQVGALENVIFGDTTENNPKDNPTPPSLSPESLSILDFD